MWVYEIRSKKFIEKKNSFLSTVFDATRSYYVVMLKDNCIAIYLWRGVWDEDLKDTN
jgi:hypothetical protein